MKKTIQTLRRNIASIQTAVRASSEFTRAAARADGPATCGNELACVSAPI